MEFSEWSTIINTIVGVIGIIVGIIGSKSLYEAKKIKNEVKNVENSTINQIGTFVNNEMDWYAVIKLTKETTREELVGIIERLSKMERDNIETMNTLESIPRIFSQKEPPENAKEGDVWLQIIDE